MKLLWVWNAVARVLGIGRWKQCPAEQYAGWGVYTCCTRSAGHPGKHKDYKGGTLDRCTEKSLKACC